MNCYCDHGQETCRALGHDHAHNARRQQLVARIKRTSKYYGQTEPGAWFDVRVVSEASDYPLRGNNNNYRMLIRLTHASTCASLMGVKWQFCHAPMEG